MIIYKELGTLSAFPWFQVQKYEVVRPSFPYIFLHGEFNLLIVDEKWTLEFSKNYCMENMPGMVNGVRCNTFHQQLTN